MIINIRGTNGSGKTTLARALIGPNPNAMDLLWYPSPTTRDPARKKSVEAYGDSGPGSFLAIGSYKQGCGGMDTIPSFDLQQQAIANAYDWVKNGQPLPEPHPDHIVAEGVLASTVFGSWGNFFSRFNKADVLIAYLDTPLEVCLDRIRARQIAAKGEGREIKKDQVADKIKAIQATKERFNKAGFLTATLRHDQAEADLRQALGILGRR